MYAPSSVVPANGVRCAQEIRALRSITTMLVPKRKHSCSKEQLCLFQRTTVFVLKPMLSVPKHRH